VEAGATCSIETVVTIADALGVPVSTLFRGRKHLATRRPGRPSKRKRSGAPT
jgi:hypothetical protein